MKRPTSHLVTIKHSHSIICCYLYLLTLSSGPIGRQLSYFCHRADTTTEAPRECGGVPSGIHFWKVQRWRAWGNLTSSSLLFPKQESPSMTVGIVGIFDVQRRTQAHWGGGVWQSFYGCQLRGAQFHGDHRAGADIVGMADWVSEKGQKSTLYELDTLSVSFTHSLSPSALWHPVWFPPLPVFLWRGNMASAELSRNVSV